MSNNVIGTSFVLDIVELGHYIYTTKGFPACPPTPSFVFLALTGASSGEGEGENLPQPLQGA